jgi:PiT family inorganic phosphate transporter
VSWVPTRPDSTARNVAKLKSLRASLDSGTKFIPTWVKVSVALALGLSTMVGWKRIVVTVGEKIGKTHLTYAQGASDLLSGGVAGTMAANGSGPQWATIKIWHWPGFWLCRRR